MVTYGTPSARYTETDRQVKRNNYILSWAPGAKIRAVENERYEIHSFASVENRDGKYAAIQSTELVEGVCPCGRDGRESR